MGEPLPDGSVTDAELIAGWQRGEEESAAELVRRHAAPLSGFLQGAGAPDEDLEDLVQETFFRAFRRLSTFRGGASFRTWVMAIGSNALKDLWRKRKRRHVIPLEGREVVDERSDPHGESQATDLEERFAASVTRLPPLQRDVFLMRAQQGAAYEEIAAALDTTPGAARVHYHHAVKRLKKMLDV